MPWTMIQPHPMSPIARRPTRSQPGTPTTRPGSRGRGAHVAGQDEQERQPDGRRGARRGRPRAAAGSGRWGRGRGRSQRPGHRARSPCRRARRARGHPAGGRGGVTVRPARLRRSTYAPTPATSARPSRIGRRTSRVPCDPALPVSGPRGRGRRDRSIRGGGRRARRGRRRDDVVGGADGRRGRRVARSAPGLGWAGGP